MILSVGACRWEGNEGKPVEIKLYPENHKTVYHRYDVERGYGAQLDAARRQFGRPELLRDTDLAGIGVVKRPVFTAAECAEINARFDDGLVGNYDRDYVVALLTRIFESALAGDMISYFQSEFVAIGADFYETEPNERPAVSDGWHCDEGPSKHLIIMAYFTPSEDDGANTLFTSRAVTDALKDAGYVYCELRHRQLEIDAVTDALRLDRAPVTALEVRAGDVIVFDAPNILHRRLIPGKAKRRTMTAAIIPSLLPWNEILAHGALPLPLGGDTYPVLPGYAGA